MNLVLPQERQGGKCHRQGSRTGLITPPVEIAFGAVTDTDPKPDDADDTPDPDDTALDADADAEAEELLPTMEELGALEELAANPLLTDENGVHDEVAGAGCGGGVFPSP